MTNPLLYAGMAAAGYLAGRGTSGRRADYDPGQELARLKEQKKARNIKPVLVEWYDHDESLMAGAAEWSGELVTTQERLDQLIALLKEDPAVHSFSWKSRDQWEPEWHIREISWDEWRWRRTRDRGPVYPRRSVPWAADAPIRQAQESGALPIGRGLDAYEVRVRKAQEQERRFQAKKEEGRAARGGRRAQEGPRPGDFVLESRYHRDAPTLMVLLPPSSDLHHQLNREAVATPFKSKLDRQKERVLLPNWREVFVTGPTATMDLGWPPNPRRRSRNPDATAFPAPDWTPAKLFGGERTVSQGVAQVDAVLAAWKIPVPPGTQLWGRRPDEWGGMGDTQWNILLGTLTPRGSKKGRAARGGRARGKTVPAGEVWAWKIEQWRSERAAGRSRGRLTLYIMIPDFSLTSWRLPAGDPGSLPLSEVYGEGTTFGPGKWVWVSGAQDAGHDSTRLFVGVGNPRHRWNVQTLDFYVPSDTPLRVRLKWER